MGESGGESPLYQVPEGMSLMECQYTSDGNTFLSGEVTFRNSNEILGYDHFRNTLQYAGDPISAPGELSTRSTVLFDIAQSSQQTVAALNYGSGCTSDFSGFSPGYHKSYATSFYRCRSPEEKESTILQPAVDEIEDRLKICSRLSTPGILKPPADRDHLKTASLVTESKAKDDEMLYCPQDSDEAAATGIVMEKILRDHFQATSEPSSYPSKTPVSFSGNNPCPTLQGMRELQDSSLMESTLTSSPRIECGMSQEPSPSGQPDQFARMASSEFSLVRPTFRRPLEVACGVQLKTSRKWNQQRASRQGPDPSFSAPSCKSENKPKTISTTLMTDRVERASSLPKRRRRTWISRGDPSVETQRITHIAVERNRRKQMNDHLSALKALMPSKFVQKTDQASIIGGAVEFVKELEVVLESLLSRQRRRSHAEILGPGWNRFNIHPGRLLCAPYAAAAVGCAPPVLSANATLEDHTSRMSSKRITLSSELLAVLPESTRVTTELRAECRSTAANVEVKVFGSDAMVNITTHRRAKQLVKVIVALESLDLSILHISVTTSNSTVLYTFNATVGPECRMTVNHVAATIQQTFSSIYANHVHDDLDFNRE